MTENSQIIGRNLKQMRKAHGLTQCDVAGILDVSFQQVQKYETGRNKLSIENLYILKNYYQTSFDSFFNGIHHHERQHAIGAKHTLIARLMEMKNKAKQQQILHVVQIMMNTDER